MKIGAIVAVVVLAALAGGVTYWVAVGRADNSSVVGGDDPLAPSPTGPHPQAVVAEPVFDFGRMILGDKDRHTFVITNEGEAVLKLGKPEMTCQCTVAKAAPDSIAPGESGEITLEWEPTSATDAFDKGATIRTNDPKMPEILLTVTGIVDQAVVIEPSGSWQVGDVSGDEKITVTGYVFSRIVDDFKILSWESDNSLLHVETTPMSEEALQERDARSGAKLVVTMEPEMPVGKFEEEFTIKTNTKKAEHQEFTITVEGTRLGPIQILPMPGTTWHPSVMAIDLGRFRASEGAGASVFLFVNGMPEGETFQIQSAESDVEGISVELTPMNTGAEGDPQRYTLAFKAAPGIEPQTRRSKESADVTVTTNHPDAKEIKFYVQFIAEP